GEFFYESVEISSDRLSIIEGNIILDGQQSFVISNLLHGTEITPIIEQEGYIFNRFVYNGVIYDNIEALLLVTDDMQGVEVYYRRIILELVFTQKGEGNSTISDTRFVYYNEELDESFIPAVLNDNVNITAIWERILFAKSREALNITALYFDNTAKTIRFVDNNSIIFTASQGNDPEAIFIGEDSPIWVLTRPGYKFLGWYYLADGEEVKLTQGDYAFDDFDDNQVEVYSKWKTLVAYQQPYDISVNVSQS